ncbi:Alcohol acetyltransferase [Fusarium oxysporum]|nr:Alcohol acetyltransferase [Fusarium oxysporum]KAJ4036050.1 Alcohol acetyltransferase [Fusarium oxysporum]KAJ4075931.1 Alcohol acetyltransferase [Fusarium oxysporum]KAJ4088317.1 Alcohol acetyltransferase [Fusarium oxysporum]KAJ4217811.1 Alcohol acetyltransferase [Fusarium oxysporum]
MSSNMIDRLRSKKSARSLNDKDKVLRKLSPVECLQAAHYSLGAIIGCAISCRYRIPKALLTSDAAAFQVIVENALARAILQHPLFTVGRINADSKKQYWVRLDQIDLKNHIEWRTVSNQEAYESILHATLEWQVNEPYTNLETQPGWRAAILQSTDSNFIDVVFAWDHTAADGKSGKVLQDSIFTCLNTPDDNAVIFRDRVFEIPNTELTPPLHHLIKLPVSLHFIVGEFGRDIIASMKAKELPHMATWAPIPTEPSKTSMAAMQVTKKALKPVLDACRQHGTTLTGLMHALIAVSMAKRLAEIKASAFLCGTPVCLRQFQKPGHPSIDLNKTAINSVAYWPFTFDEDLVAKFREQINEAETQRDMSTGLEATVWSSAKAIRDGLSAKLDLGTKNDHIGLAKFVKDWQSFVKDHGKTRSYSWEISNLGVIQGKAEGEGDNWAIESATFTQTAPTFGSALTFSVISAKGGDLTVTNTWQDGVVEEELALGVSSDVEGWLNELGNTGSIRFGAVEMSS